MVPNNNLSVLPFYTSIEQQNARKWWIYGKIYPLFTPTGSILPFQITRPNRTAYVPGELLENEDYDSGYLTTTGEWRQDNVTPADVSVYNVTGKQRVYVENMPFGYEENPSVVFKSGLTTLSYNITHTTYTGVIDVPEGATEMYIQSYNEQAGSEYVSVYDASPVIVPIVSMIARKPDGTIYKDLTSYITTIFQYKQLEGKDVIIYNGDSVGSWDIGQYFLVLSDGVDTWYSDIFTAVSDMSGYLKLEWWDIEDFVMDAGTIVYEQPEFKNVLYLCSDIAKPEYEFSEDVIERDGYTFPVKQVSQKRYRFSFLASEYLLDVMRFVRMSDYARITKDGQTWFNLDTFLISPEWEDNGDVAVVNAEFTCGTVAKKNGRGYISNNDD